MLVLSDSVSSTVNFGKYVVSKQVKINLLQKFSHFQKMERTELNCFIFFCGKNKKGRVVLVYMDFAVVVHLPSHVQLFATAWTGAHQALSSTNSQSLLKLMSTESVVLSNLSSSAIPFSFCLQSFPVSGSFLMSQLCIRWLKYWSFSFSISPSSKHSGLISFRIDWFDLLDV